MRLIGFPIMKTVVLVLVFGVASSALAFVERWLGHAIHRARSVRVTCCNVEVLEPAARAGESPAGLAAAPER
jgi:hypothetical protein